MKERSSDQCPEIETGQYVQAHVGWWDKQYSTEEERTVDALYLGHADDGSGHEVFKLSTKERISVNKVTVLSTPQAFIDLVNMMGEKENQPDGIQFSDMHGNTTILDLDDDSLLIKTIISLNITTVPDLLQMT